MFDEKTLAERYATDSLADLTEAERRLVEGIRRLMPHYRFGLSRFVKPRPAAEESAS